MTRTHAIWLLLSIWLAASSCSFIEDMWKVPYNFVILAALLWGMSVISERGKKR